MKDLHFIGAAYCNEFLWFSSLERNGCYRADMTNGKSKFIGFFEKEDLFTSKLYMETLSCGDEIYYVPWFAEHLASVNAKTLEFRYWKLPDTAMDSIGKFKAAALYDKKIYMFPQWGNDVLIFDVEKGEFETDNSWMPAFTNYAVFDIRNKFAHGYVNNEDIFLPSMAGNIIMKYNLKNRSNEIIQFDEEQSGMLDITNSNNNELFILACSGNVWKYSLDTGKKQLFCKGVENNSYRHVVYHGGRLVFLPFSAREIKILDLSDGGEEEIPYPEKFSFVDKRAFITSKFSGYINYGEDILLNPCLGNSALILHGKRLIKKNFYEANSMERVDKLIHFCIKYKIDLNENKIGLEKMLDMLNELNTIEGNLNSKESCGKKIWNDIKRGIE